MGVLWPQIFADDGVDLAVGIQDHGFGPIGIVVIVRKSQELVELLLALNAVGSGNRDMGIVRRVRLLDQQDQVVGVDPLLFALPVYARLFGRLAERRFGLEIIVRCQVV